MRTMRRRAAQSSHGHTASLLNSICCLIAPRTARVRLTKCIPVVLYVCYVAIVCRHGQFTKIAIRAVHFWLFVYWLLLLFKYCNCIKCLWKHMYPCCLIYCVRHFDVKSKGRENHPNCSKGRKKVYIFCYQLNSPNLKLYLWPTAKKLSRWVL